jgi:uncharacterized repeat protein (TIGR01451 family)
VGPSGHLSEQTGPLVTAVGGDQALLLVLLWCQARNERKVSDMNAASHVFAPPRARRWGRSVALGLMTGQASAGDITSDGPLTQLGVSETLNCSVLYAEDEQPEFYGSTACGTFLATGGSLFGPSYIPAGSSLGSYLSHELVSQSEVRGEGTFARPFSIKTVVMLPGTNLRIVEVDSYVVGQESYRTDVTVQNLGSAAVQAVLYRAGDCYLQNSDYGFGSSDPSTGAVACVAGRSDQNGTWVPGDRIQQWLPLSSGSSYIQAHYSDVWAAIATQQPFPNTGRFSESIDNGAGLSWSLSVPAAGSVVRSHLTTFSPQGQLPLSIMKTADSAESLPGEVNGYTITVSNPNPEAVDLEWITDSLPDGFTYVPGSTSGALQGEPGASGNDLTWDGPIGVPGTGELIFHFEVTVSDQPGEFTNDAEAFAPPYTVAPAEEAAEISVGGPGVRGITLQANKTSVAKGRKVAFSGSVFGDEACVAGQAVEIRFRKNGTSRFKSVASTTTDSLGAYLVKVRIEKPGSFRSAAPPTATCGLAVSDVWKIKVK